MKRKYSVLLSLALVAVFTIGLLAPASAAITQDNKLKFNADGKFTILQIADTQDIFIPRVATVEAINKALDAVKPDLVVFTGDNITGSGNFNQELTQIAIDSIVEPVAKRDIPFTVTFGNHDDEGSVSKDEQLKMYQKYDNCLAYDAVPALYGTGTHNLPILSSDGAKNAYNLWIIDSNTYDTVNGGYDYVHEDQVDWYVQQSNALKAENGGNPLPSLVFQHIPVPEIYACYKAVPAGTEGSRERFGGNWAMELNPDMASGALNEWSCPPDSNHGEFAAMAAQGDVVGMVFGHDHVNSFIGTVDGIDLIQSPGIGYFSYGDEAVRGVRVITLDENDTAGYDTQIITNNSLFGSPAKSWIMNNLFGGYVSYPASILIFLNRLLTKLFSGLFA